MSLTDDQLAAIEARTAAATAGPWASGWDECAPWADPREAHSVYSTAEIPEDDRPVCSVMWFDGDMSACTEPDAAFIAHAREDVPALVAGFRRLRLALASHAEKLTDHRNWLAEAWAENREQAALLGRCRVAMDQMGRATVGDRVQFWDMSEVFEALEGLCGVAADLGGEEE